MDHGCHLPRISGQYLQCPRWQVRQYLVLLLRINWWHSLVLSTFSAWDSPWQFSVLRLCSPSSSWCWDATPPWAASWAAPNRSRPSLPASLFSSGASTCSFPPWKPTKSSIPVSKPIFITKNRFWQTAHFFQPTNQKPTWATNDYQTKIGRSKSTILHTKKYYQMTMFQQHKTKYNI